MSCLVVSEFEATTVTAVPNPKISEADNIFCEEDSMSSQTVDGAQRSLYHGTTALHKYLQDRGYYRTVSVYRCRNTAANATQRTQMQNYSVAETAGAYRMKVNDVIIEYRTRASQESDSKISRVPYRLLGFDVVNSQP